MSELTPLVGFHGHTDGVGLLGLGLILVDAVSPICQESKTTYNLSQLGDMSAAQIAEIIENGITAEESERAILLESVLRAHVLEKTKDDKSVLIGKITNLIN